LTSRGITIPLPFMLGSKVKLEEVRGPRTATVIWRLWKNTR